MARFTLIKDPNGGEDPLVFISQDPVPERLTREQADSRFRDLSAKMTAALVEHGSESDEYAGAWYDLHHHWKVYGAPAD